MKRLREERKKRTGRDQGSTGTNARSCRICQTLYKNQSQDYCSNCGAFRREAYVGGF